MKQPFYPWFTDFLSLTAPPKLSRDEFVARYLPKYVGSYTPLHTTRMRTNAAGRMYVVNSGSGAKGVVSKRERRIDEAFASYLAAYSECEAGGHWVSQEEAQRLMNARL